jgi:hypothetical protein
MSPKTCGDAWNEENKHQVMPKQSKALPSDIFQIVDAKGNDLFFKQRVFRVSTTATNYQLLDHEFAVKKA